MLLAGYYCCTTAIFEIYPTVAMLMTREKKKTEEKTKTRGKAVLLHRKLCWE